MDVIKISIAIVVCAIISVVLRQQKVEYSVVIGLAVGVICYVFLAKYLTEIFDFIRSLSDSSQLVNKYLPLLLKASGIALIVQLCGDVCRDAGENGLASKIEMMGKVVIITFALPLLTELLRLIQSI